MSTSMRQIFLALLLFWGGIAHGEQYSREAVDSLESIIQQAPDDTTKINAMIELLNVIHIEKPDTVLPLVDVVIELSRKAGFHKGLCISYVQKGNYYRTRGQPEEARYWIERSIALADSIQFKRGVANGLNSLGLFFLSISDNELALENYKKSLQLFQEIGDSHSLAVVYHNIGKIHRVNLDHEKALEVLNRSLEIEESTGNKSGVSITLISIGNIYYQQGIYPEALRYYIESINIKEELGERLSKVPVLNNVGVIYYMQGAYEKSLEYMNESLLLVAEAEDKISEITLNQNIASTYGVINKPRQALPYYRKSTRLALEINNPLGLGESYLGIGSLFKKVHATDSIRAELAMLPPEESKNWDEEHLLDSAAFYLNSAIEIFAEVKSEHDVIRASLELGDVLLWQGKPQASKEMFNRVYVFADSNKIMVEKYQACNGLYRAYKSLGDIPNALKWHEAFTNLKDQVLDSEKQEALAKLETDFEWEKKLITQQKEQEKQKAISDERNQSQQKIIYFISGGLGIVLILLGFLANRFILIRKQKNIIADQKEIVDQKNNDITASIRYAKRIQNAILISDGYLERTLKDYFVLYLPKDVVSGDFYWCYQTADEKCIWAACDCTGHGVPGAFMSLIGNSLLNEIVVEQGITAPHKILNALRTAIIKTLNKEGQENETKDGMDIALCCWDKQTHILTYAGAYNPLYLVRKGGVTEAIKLNSSMKVYGMNDELLEVKADRQPIGPYAGKLTPFQQQELPLRPGDQLYVFSDGFPDQFGGPKKRKFTAKHFRQLILSIQDETMQDQKNILEKTLNDWKGNLGQTDDICVIGMRV